MMQRRKYPLVDAEIWMSHMGTFDRTVKRQCHSSKAVGRHHGPYHVHSRAPDYGPANGAKYPSRVRTCNRSDEGRFNLMSTFRHLPSRATFVGT
jgi:hypothetical protein